MKIGINCFPTVGGSGIAATQLAFELAKKGHDIHLVSYDTPFLLRSIRHPNITLDLVDVLSYPLFRDIGAPYTILAASKLVNLSKKWNLDILNVHYAIPTGVSAYLAKQVTDTPVAITAHGSDIHILGIDPSYNPIVSHVLQNVDGISTVSKYMKNEIIDKFARNKNVEVIYNPIDTERYKKIEGQICDFRMKYETNFAHVSNFRPVKDTPLENLPPTKLQRESRLYQASFLIRDYGFSLREIPFDETGNLPIEKDPKLSWAQTNLRENPMEINQANRRDLLHIPGIGPRGVKAIVATRIHSKISNLEDLRKIGINTKRVAPFILLNGRRPSQQLALL